MSLRVVSRNAFFTKVGPTRVTLHRALRYVEEDTFLIFSRAEFLIRILLSLFFKCQNYQIGLGAVRQVMTAATRVPGRAQYIS